MGLRTFSQFYYGHTVTYRNNAIDFKEGAGPELQATLNTGDYTLLEYADEIKKALDAAGGLTYTVTVNRATRIITIAAPTNFSLLVSSGSRIGSGAWTIMGFTGADRVSGTSFAGDSGSGFSYRTQAVVDDYTPAENWLEKNDAVVNTSASGLVNVVQFGDTRMIAMNIRLATDKAMNQPEVETQANGVANLRAFMEYAITKAKFDFMPDRDQPDTYYKVLLESTAVARDGTAYKLKELQKVGGGFFETDTITLRVVR